MNYTLNLNTLNMSYGVTIKQKVIQKMSYFLYTLSPIRMWLVLHGEVG